MNANLLTLNSSKTEFLLIGLKNHLPKYTALHLTPPTQLETLASSLTDTLLSLTKLQLSPKPVTITFVNFAVSGLTLIRQLPVGLPLLPLSFTPNLITVILSTILPKSQFSRLQQIQNSLARTVMKPPKSCHISPILRSLQAPLTYLQSSHNYPTSVPS